MSDTRFSKSDTRFPKLATWDSKPDTRFSKLDTRSSKRSNRLLSMLNNAKFGAANATPTVIMPINSGVRSIPPKA